MKASGNLRYILALTIYSYVNLIYATINFNNENARFILKDNKSLIVLKPSSVLGWQDRSIIKNITGRGLGDYNLKTYSEADNIVSYDKAPGELVYDNSNAIIRLSTTSDNLSINNSNAIIKLDVTTRTNSNAMLYLNRTTSNALLFGNRNNSNAIVLLDRKVRVNSNAIVKLSNNVKIYDTQQIYSTNTTVENLAWYKAGFEVYPAKILALKTPIAITGQISLGGTLTLSSDLFLDSGTTFSSSYGLGRIQGNGNALHLNGNLLIPSNHIMRIDGNLVVEGNGNTITLGDNAQLFIDDSVTLTLRNIILKNSKNNAGNPAIKLSSFGSKLALDNSKLNLADDFYFYRGQLFIYNDVEISGSSAFIYQSSQPSFITSGATLKFGTGTTLDYQPTTTGLPTLLGEDLIIMQDKSSKLLLNGCTLKSTQTGFRLTSGQLILDNKVTLSSNVSRKLRSFDTNFSSTTMASKPVVSWSPDDRYIVAADRSHIFVYNFDGTSLTQVGSTLPLAEVGAVSWSPDGQFIAVKLTNNLIIYRFLNTSLTAVTPLKSFSEVTNNITWSADGKYLAASTNTSFNIYSFNGTSLNLVATSPSIAGTITGIDWNKDGKHIAISKFSTTNSVIIYNFENNTLNQTTSIAYGDNLFGINWSPDGRFLVGPSNSAHSYVIFTFTGNALSCFTSYSLSTYGTTTSFHPEGHYIVGASNFYKKINLLRVNQTALTLISDNIYISEGIGLLKWNYKGNFLAATTENSSSFLRVYRVNSTFEGPGQSLDKSIVFGHSSLGSIYDLNVQLLSGANVSVEGILNYDNSLGGTIFSNDNSRFTITGPNSKIRLNPNTVVGWKDRSIVKNITGGGLGDYNLKTYSGTDNIVTYAEASGELVYDNSNAIIKLDRNVRTNSNAFAYGIRNNSNALKYQADHFISVNNGKVTVLGAINGSTNVLGRSLLSSPIDLLGGTLTLGSDMILSNQTTIHSSGNFDLQGNALIFGGNLTLPANVAIKIISSGVLDGLGNELINSINSKLIIDNNVTLTLRNINWRASGSPQIEMRAATSKLTLQNVSLVFDRDYSFTQGQLFIQDDVFITGTNKFSYSSTGTSYIASHSTLYFDKNTTFSYSPRVSGRHTQSERNLIKMVNNTSSIFFDECTLQLPDSGWQLINGTIYFNNKIKVYGQSNIEQSFEFGNGISNNNPDLFLLSGANIENYGYIYTNFGN